MKSPTPRSALARSLALAGWLMAGVLITGAAQAQGDPAAEAAPTATALPAPSLTARKVYEQARSQLVQIRTVLKGRASQTSLGSGFFV